MTLTTYKWSISQWHELIETGMLADRSVELLEGEIITTSPEGIPHTYTNQSVADHLRKVLQEKAHIRDAHPITLKNSEPEPDIAIVRLPEDIYKKHHPYPEDIYWLIEVANKTLKIDLGKKSEIYADNNIPEYWVIDLVNQKVIVHTQPKDNVYSQITEHKTGTVSSQAFPNVLIPLNRLLLF